MKKTSIFLIFNLVVMVSLMVASCNKDTVTLRAHFEQFHGNNGQKLYIDNATPIWMSTDMVYVNFEYVPISLNGGNATLEAEADPNGYTAIFTGGNRESRPVDNTDGYSFDIPQTLVYQEYEVSANERRQIVPAPMYAYSPNANTPLEFKNMGAVMEITITNETANETSPRDLIIDNVIVTASDLPLWGTATIDASDHNNPTYSCAPTDNKTIYLDISNGNTVITLYADADDGITSKTVYVCVPPTTSENHYTITVCAHQPNGNIVHYRHQQGVNNTHNGSIGRNKIAPIPFSLSGAPVYEEIRNLQGIVQNAIFTVGVSNGVSKKVYFSQGNLQWRKVGTHGVQGGGTVSGEWRFAEHQWDYVGDQSNGNVYVGETKCNNRNIVVSDNPYWIDLFGWGTSGFDDKNPNNWRDITSQYYFVPNGNDINLSSTNGNVNYDWGVYNAISNGGNEPGKWRTLTNEEWYYLINTRTTVDGQAGRDHSYKLVELNDVKGMLLFKDGYGSTSGITSPISGPVPDGCVFLPFAGFREGASSAASCVITSAGIVGNYWSATGRSRSSADMYNAYYCPLSGSLNDQNVLNPTLILSSETVSCGRSVRLVMEIPN